METIKKSKTILVLHPFLFGFYVVLSLYAQNSQLVSVVALRRPVVVVTICTLLIWLFWLTLLRSPAKSGIFTIAALFVFFMYGTIIRIVVQFVTRFGDSDLFVAVVLGVVGLTPLCILGALVWRSPWSFAVATRFFNVATVVLVILAVGEVIWAKSEQRSVQPISSRDAPISIREPIEEPPDIYQIILDGYAREDVLSGRYGFDNSAFLNELEARDFYVAHESSSNYHDSAVSLSSMLNMEYHAAHASGLTRLPVRNYLRDNVVVKFLRSKDYRFVAFSSGYSPTEFREADEFRQLWSIPSEFETALMERTPLRLFKLPGIGFFSLYPLERKLQKYWPISAMCSIGEHWSHVQHRNRILYNLDGLESMEPGKSPQFVFAHLISPHYPYVFQRNGDLVKNPKRRNALHIPGYLEQIEYLNSRVLSIVDSVLAKKPNTIILVHSDHGSRNFVGFHDSFEEYSSDSWKNHVVEFTGNLTAIHLPKKKGEEALYQKISLVNVYRVILNHYFGTELVLLDDVRYVARKPFGTSVSDVIEVNDSFVYSPTPPKVDIKLPK